MGYKINSKDTRIISKKIMVKSGQTRIIRLDINAPQISRQAQPGQFVVLMVKEEGERIPLTIVDKNIKEGTITLIFQEVGLTTRLLGEVDSGDSLYVLLGPLGKPTEVKNYGKVILVGGGVGIAEIYPVAKALKENGNYIVTILGARTKNLLVLEKELKDASDEVFTITDDGSYGKKGVVTDILRELLNKEPKNHKSSSNKYNLIYAVGPIPMMKKVSEITKIYNIKTIVSLNALMVDATGMCGCCRVNVGGEIKFSCVDGPEFDAHLVDWDNLLKRNSMYLDKERHICKLLLE